MSPRLLSTLPICSLEAGGWRWFLQALRRLSIRGLVVWLLCALRQPLAARDLRRGERLRAWMTPRDEGWLVQMADGDRTALAEVLSAYGSTVLSLVEHIIGPSSEAEEVVQEVFLLLWRQAPCWPARPSLPLGAWLVHKARCMALAELHRAPELAAAGRDVALLPRRQRFEPYFCDSNNAESLRAARRRSRRALASLRPTARRLLSLTLLRNLTPAALGELTGQPSPKARRLLLAAVRCAREALRAQSDAYR